MELLDEFEVSNILDIPLSRLYSWDLNGKLPATKFKKIRFYKKSSLYQFPIAKEIFDTNWDNFIKIKPKKKYNTIELFAGAGGMAVGMESRV